MSNIKLNRHQKHKALMVAKLYGKQAAAKMFGVGIRTIDYITKGVECPNSNEGLDYLIGDYGMWILKDIESSLFKQPMKYETEPNKQVQALREYYQVFHYTKQKLTPEAMDYREAMGLNTPREEYGIF